MNAAQTTAFRRAVKCQASPPQPPSDGRRPVPSPSTAPVPRPVRRGTRGVGQPAPVSPAQPPKPSPAVRPPPPPSAPQQPQPAPSAVRRPAPAPSSSPRDISATTVVNSVKPVGGFQIQFPRESSGASTSTPEYPYVVIVEGWNDCTAVRRVATCPVIIMGGANVGTQLIERDQVDDIRATMRRWRTDHAVILTDPDFAGRQLRDALDRSLGPLALHAFVSGLEALTKKDDARHVAGDLGVEYAGPRAVLDALSDPREARPERKAISKADLMERGLVQEFGAEGKDSHADSKAKQSKLYRFLVGLILGLGESTGKQFLAQLNKYDFTLEEVDDALAVAKKLVAKLDGNSAEVAESGGPEWWRKFLL